MKMAFFTFLVFSTYCCFAQPNFKPGYVVSITGDTIKGEIDYRNWDFNPENISFQQNGLIKNYTVPQLRSFAVTGEDTYRSYQVSYHLSASDLEDAGRNFGEEKESKMVFLRLLYQGPLSLYELNTPKRKYFFIKSEGESPKELIYRVRLIEGQLLKDEQYKTLLAQYILDDNRAALEASLERIEYRQKDLLGFLMAFNKDNSSAKEELRVRTIKDISLGLSLLSFSTQNTNPYFLNEVDFKPSVGIKLGGGFTFSSRRSLGRFQSRAGINLRYLTMKGDNPVSSGSSVRTNFDSYFFTIEPHFSLGMVLNPLKNIKHIISLELGYNIVAKNNFGIRRENQPGSLTKLEIPGKGGFLSAGLNYTIVGDFGRLGLQAGLLSNFLDVPTGKLSGTAISLIYSFIFN